ncbi:MAG: MauE/DoxX family redox-associated membrane protein [Dermatophilaceae bacterium]
MSEALLAVVAVTLVVAGAAHLRAPRELRAALDSHAVLARSVRGPVSVGLPLVEVALGVGVLLALATGAAATVLVGLLAAALLTAMTVYVHVAAGRSAGRAVPCGCGVGEAPLGLWVTVRSALLAGLALVGALTVGAAPTLARPGSELVIMAAAVVALSISLAALPGARAHAEVAR